MKTKESATFVLLDGSISISPYELVNDLWFYWVCYVDLMVIDTADSFHDVESWLGVSVNEQLVFLKKLLK
jgi:hypothetical protein